jgi:hypothetical protein
LSNAIIFDAKAAKREVQDSAQELSDIRTFRRNYEAHQELQPATEVLKKLLAKSLSYAIVRGKTVWKFNYLKHMPDVLSLPSVFPVIRAVSENANAGEIYALWETAWDKLCAEMIWLESECKARLVGNSRLD